MTEGVDYSDAHPDPAGLYGAGKRFVCRYGGAGTSDKWITADEVAALHGAGLSIVANVEGAARGLIGGAKVGALWADLAEHHFYTLGMPITRPIYFSADWDVQAVEWPTVRAALEAAGRVIGASRVGIYGGRHAIEWAQRDRVAAWFWQTYAWSGNPTVWVPGVHIQQYRNGVTVAGGDCDLDRALTVDFGQWEANNMLDLSQSIPGTATPPHVTRDRTLGEVLGDLYGVRAIEYGERNPVPGTPLANHLDHPLVLDAAGAALIAAALEPMIVQAVESVVRRVGLTVTPDV